MKDLEYAARTKVDEVTVSTTSLTIEHILPQSWSQNWPLSNGVVAPCNHTLELLSENYEVSDETTALMEKRQEAVNTFGNLTILTQPLNSRVGNAAWDVKRQHFGESLLALNREIAKQLVWNEDKIAKRASDLAAMAQVLWPTEPTN